MKKLGFKVVAILLAGSFLFSSCAVGSFSLFNKYAKWQTHMTSDKYVNAIVGFFLGGFVYPITLFVDSIVLNTIEFWTGSNPLAENVGKTQTIQGQDGVLYAVTTLENGYQITNPAGEVTMLVYNAANDSWSIEQNGMTQELFRYNGDGTITATTSNESLTFALNEQGVNEARWTSACSFFAMK